MSAPSGFRLIVGLAFSLWTATPAFAQSANPEDHQECRNGAAMELARQHELAAAHWLACAQVSGQTPYMIAKSRLGRFRALEALALRSEAESELVILTSTPVSDFKVFTRDGAMPGSLLNNIAKTSVGVTQPRLLTVLASYRLVAEDGAAAVRLAERAMRTAGRDPASESEISGAYVVRAKARFLNKDESGAIADIVAAYVRGSDDTWVKAQVDGFPMETVARLGELRSLMLEQAGAYAGATSSMAILATPDEARKEAIAKALATLSLVEAQEAQVVGPRKWDTPN